MYLLFRKSSNHLQILYRVIPGFLIQFGVAADPTAPTKEFCGHFWDESAQEWQTPTLVDEPKLAPFEEGTISFAGHGSNSRTCHLFIALAPNGLGLGTALHETPLGKVTKGLGTLNQIVANHQAAFGANGDTGFLQQELVLKGNVGAAAFPQLDRFEYCFVETAADTPRAAALSAYTSKPWFPHAPQDGGKMEERVPQSIAATGEFESTDVFTGVPTSTTPNETMGELRESTDEHPTGSFTEEYIWDVATDHVYAPSGDYSDHGRLIAAGAVVMVLAVVGLLASSYNVTNSLCKRLEYEPLVGVSAEKIELARSPVAGTASTTAP